MGNENKKHQRGAAERGDEGCGLFDGGCRYLFVVVMLTGKHQCKDIEHYYATGIDHDLNGTEEGVPHEEVEACGAKEHKDQVGGGAHDMLGRYGQNAADEDDGGYDDK